MWPLAKLALIFIVLPVLILAQSGNSAISGTVKDGSGAPIPGALVKLTNLDTGVVADSASNESGIYRFGSLVPGSYRIEADSQGFEHLVRSSVLLQVGQALAVDLSLTVGVQTETVTVNEAAPLTDSLTSKIAQTVTKEMLGGLPLPNRAASSLAALSPGAVMIDTGSGT